MLIEFISIKSFLKIFIDVAQKLVSKTAGQMNSSWSFWSFGFLALTYKSLIQGSGMGPRNFTLITPGLYLKKKTFIPPNMSIPQIEYCI